MSTPLLDYLRTNCIELIQEERFAEVYDKVLTNRGYSNSIGELTELLYECGGDPLTGLTEIPVNFLKDVSHAQDIKLTKKVKKIHNSSFANCPSVKSIDLSNLFTKLPNHCFDSSTSLQAVLGIESVKCVEDGCFNNCSSLESVILGKELLYIAPDGFARCGLKDIIVYEDCTICSYAFRACSQLRTATLGAYMIKRCAFSDCTSLRSVTLTNPMMTLDREVFEGCTSLTEVTFAGTKSEWNKLNKAYEWRGNAPIKVVHCSDGDVKFRG